MGSRAAAVDGSIDLSTWRLHNPIVPDVPDEDRPYYYGGAMMLMSHWYLAMKTAGEPTPLRRLLNLVAEPRSYAEVVGWLDETSGCR